MLWSSCETNNECLARDKKSLVTCGPGVFIAREWHAAGGCGGGGVIDTESESSIPTLGKEKVKLLLINPSKALWMV